MPFFQELFVVQAQHKTPFPMLRLPLLFACAILSFSVLQAQSSASGRQTTQDLSPAAASLQQEQTEVANFSRKLSALKTAYAEKNQNQVVASEAFLLRAMRNETDQMMDNAKTAPNSIPVKVRLEKMNAIMDAFEAHSFNALSAEAAKRDFAKMDEFLLILQEALSELK